TDFEGGWVAFDEMIRLHVEEHHRPLDALAVAERARGRVLLEGFAQSADARPVDPLAARLELADDVVVLYYVTLPDRVLSWTLPRGGPGFSDQRIDKAALGALVRRFRTNLTNGSSIASVREAGAPLRRILIDPAAPALGPGTTIVVIGDNPLDGLPFGAL